MLKYAFKCQNCGACEPPESAGENAVPSACHICRSGVGDPSNWIVLVDLSESELRKAGLTKAEVVKPNPSRISTPPTGRTVKVTAFEVMGSTEVAG
jgi:hypothetical protein